MASGVVERWGRTFRCTDDSPELPPGGEFTREIVLPGRIPDNAELDAFPGDGGRTIEILVPKLKEQKEEKEVRLFLAPS
jgi:hypothetical protein